MPVVVKQYHTVNPLRVGDYEDRFLRGSAVIASSAGGKAALYNSLSYPAQYVLEAEFANLDTMWAWVRSEDAQALAVAEGLGIVATGDRPTELWEVVSDVAGGGEPRYVRLVDWELDLRPGNAEQFEFSRGEYFALLRSHDGGFVGSRLLRLMGNPTRYQSVHLREGLNGIADHPAVAAFLREHPVISYSSRPVRPHIYRLVGQR